MSVIISSTTSTSAVVGAARDTALAPSAVNAQSTKPAPAATVEISSAARQAAFSGQGRTPAHTVRPLNIIWGDSPR